MGGGFYEVKENLIPQVSNIVCGFERRKPWKIFHLKERGMPARVNKVENTFASFIFFR
jgi:hypothetical protein